MLLIDGVKYKEWTPEGENAEEELEQMVKEHAQDIFGEHSIYLDKKQKLKSLAGVGSIPDGLVIMFENVPEWHIVEVELSSHDPYGHIVPQVDRFLNGIDNRDTCNKIIEALYDAIYGDEFLKLKIRQAIGLDKDVHKFLSDLIARPPTITIVIQEYTGQLREALKKYNQKRVVEFQTFVREGAEAVHAHLFEPLYKIAEKKSERVSETRETITHIQREESRVLEIKVKITPASIRYGYIPFPKRNRLLFPGYDEPFTLVTDIGEITPHVTGARLGTQVGDLNAGNRIGKNLKPWYKKHRELQTGDEIIIKTIEPMKKYRLEIVK